MFGFMIDWPDAKERLRNALDAHWRRWAGAAFMALAMFAIEYEEIIQPGVDRLSGAWGSAASELGRKLTSLAL
jgi:hypothetical protein